jgi:hypothetical protein
MDNLVPGVDNVRHDVLIGPKLQGAITKLMKQIMAEKTDSSDLLDIQEKTSSQNEKKEFKQVFGDTMKNVLKKANAEHNFEIFLLANISIIKFFIQTFHEEFKSLIRYIDDFIKYNEKRHGLKPETLNNLAKKMGDIKGLRTSLYKDTMGVLLDSIHWLYKTDLNKMIESLFGEQASFPQEVFFNPLLQSSNVRDVTIMMEKYIILGDRSEDPDRYESLIDLLFDLFHEMDKGCEDQKVIAEKKTGLPLLEKHLKELRGEREPLQSSKLRLESRKRILFKQRRQNRLEKITIQLNKLNKKIEAVETEYQALLDEIKASQEKYDEQIEKWICHVENMNVLFDYIDSQEQYREMKKKKKVPKGTIRQKKREAKRQIEIFNLVYERFCKKGLLNMLVASYKMLPIIPQYCPPLNPRQILNALISPKERKKTVDQLERFHPGKSDFGPLDKMVKEIKKLKLQTKKQFLIQFLMDFARYHRDLKNHNQIFKVMDRITLQEKKNIIEMSRINKTLYEILLPDEEEKGEARIIGHVVLKADVRGSTRITLLVVLKADVRGSTRITLLMNERKLNSASHFSMNFFIPISEILPIYDATKIFVEGDAYILSIFEKTGSATFYSVARACGLAQHMLRIIKHYNQECIKNKLPILELGIGICYRDSSPMFLFDGDNRIMISPALNLSDRLSSCSKSVRKLFAKKTLPFNLYVFQDIPDEEFEQEDPEKSLLRYNVNGIQLNEEGFVKLQNEISLRCFEISGSGLWKEKTRIHTGRFPTLTGSYQNLYIRESMVARVNASNLHFIEWTSRRYFEVCTNPKISELIENVSAESAIDI